RTERRESLDQHIRRAPNAFMIYRHARLKQWHHYVKALPEVDPIQQSLLSKVIGYEWSRKSPALAAAFQGLADVVKEEHKRRYPDYRYQP
ncbi:hypothetical protein BD413DRAFT_435774, partial [Trametes elegans]